VIERFQETFTFSRSLNINLINIQKDNENLASLVCLLTLCVIINCHVFIAIYQTCKILRYVLYLTFIKIQVILMPRIYVLRLRFFFSLNTH